MSESDFDLIYNDFMDVFERLKNGNRSDDILNEINETLIYIDAIIEDLKGEQLKENYMLINIAYQYYKGRRNCFNL